MRSGETANTFSTNPALFSVTLIPVKLKIIFSFRYLIKMTGQVLDSPVASLVLPVLMRPILSNLERQDMVASQTLRAALSKVSPFQLMSSLTTFPSRSSTLTRGSLTTSS